MLCLEGKSLKQNLGIITLNISQNMVQTQIAVKTPNEDFFYKIIFSCTFWDYYIVEVKKKILKTHFFFLLKFLLISVRTNFLLLSVRTKKE